MKFYNRIKHSVSLENFRVTLLFYFSFYYFIFLLYANPSFPSLHSSSSPHLHLALICSTERVRGPMVSQQILSHHQVEEWPSPPPTVPRLSKVLSKSVVNCCEETPCHKEFAKESMYLRACLQQFQSISPWSLWWETDRPDAEAVAESLNLIGNRVRERNWAWHGLLKPYSATTRPPILNSPLGGKQAFKYRSLWWPLLFKPPHLSFLFQPMGVQSAPWFSSITKHIRCVPCRAHVAEVIFT